MSIEDNELFHIMIAEPLMYGQSIRESDDERDNAITTRVAVDEEAAEDVSVDGEKGWRGGVLIAPINSKAAP